MHLYALVSGPVDSSTMTGIGERPVRQVEAGGLTAIVSYHDEVPATTKASALAHHEVVTAVADQAPTLPVRFGAAFQDRGSLVTMLGARADELQAAVRDIGERVEYVVRPSGDVSARSPRATTARAPADRQQAEGGGRTYLLERLDEHRAWEQAAAVVVRQLEAIDRSVAPLAVRGVERSGPLGPERCYLVDRARADQFRQAVGDALAVDGVGIEVGGPLPPYTFAAAAAPA